MRLARLIRCSQSLVSRASRIARPSSSAWNIFKTFLQSALFWTVFLLALPHLAQRAENSLWPGARKYLQSPLWVLLGQILFVCSGLLGIASGLTMALRGRGTPLPLDAPRELVIAGPYRWVRNPMALAGLAQGVAVGLWRRSPLVILYALCGGPLWNWLVRPGEEDALEQRFGEPYRIYRRAVKCWRWRSQAYRTEGEPL